IVVTETRAPEPILDVIGNITQLGAEELAEIRAEHPSEALNRAPGVYVHRGSGQEHLTSIRSPVLTGGAGAGSFLYLENNVPLRAAGFANVNGLFDAHSELAQSIEIVRGPGSVLHGANAVHGLINVITPTAEESSAGLAFSGGSFDRYKGDIWATYAGGAHGGYVGFSEIFDGGFRADTGVDQQKLTLRHDNDGERVTVSTVLSGHNLNQETGGFVIGDDAYLDPELRRTNPNPEAFRNVKSVRLSSRITRALSENAEVVVTPNARWNEMDFLLHFLP
ncbi:MAG: TonB-dependent receptor plug domain-containing protein, partial [Pseudomonadota bacterium]